MGCVGAAVGEPPDPLVPGGPGRQWVDLGACRHGDHLRLGPGLAQDLRPLDRPLHIVGVHLRGDLHHPEGLAAGGPGAALDQDVGVLQLGGLLRGEAAGGLRLAEERLARFGGEDVGVEEQAAVAARAGAVAVLVDPAPDLAAQVVHPLGESLDGLGQLGEASVGFGAVFAVGGELFVVAALGLGQLGEATIHLRPEGGQGLVALLLGLDEGRHRLGQGLHGLSQVLHRGLQVLDGPLHPADPPGEPAQGLGGIQQLPGEQALAQGLHPLRVPVQQAHQVVEIPHREPHRRLLPQGAILAQNPSRLPARIGRYDAPGAT
jgi:hypothetical protein